MKKIALLFFGFSYTDNNSDIDHYYNIDFRDSVNNYNKYILNHYKQLNYEIDIFFSTYDHKYRNLLIDTYKPKDHHFEDKYIINSRISRNTHFLKAMDLCYNYSLNNDIDYDYVIITRFDLLFQISFDKVLIDYNKMNIVSILEKRSLICDNLYIFPFDKINEFIITIRENINVQSHNYENIIIPIFGEINFFSNQDPILVENLSFYKINRISEYKKIKNKKYINNTENIEFILNKIKFKENIKYTNNYNSSLCISDSVINFSKNNNDKSIYSWFGYDNIQQGPYNVMFDVLANKKLEKQFNIGIKTHFPETVLKNEFIDNVIENEWSSCLEEIDIKKDNDLCIFIFDGFQSTLDLKIKDIEFIKEVMLVNGYLV